MSYTMAWRNRRTPHYAQICYPHELESLEPKLYQLIKKFGTAFDDYWYYRLAGRTRKVIVRVPLWQGSQKRIDCEGFDHYQDIYQTKLTLKDEM